MRSSIIISSGRRGVALIAVLAVLGLITVLIISFLSSVSSEVNISQSGASTSHVQQLADSVPQIIISRISDATTGHLNPSDATSASVSWASQPGMIRTFNLDGTPAVYYRLYSGPSPTVPWRPHPVFSDDRAATRHLG